MPFRSLVMQMFLVSLAVMVAGGAFGQAYPQRPIHIVTGSPGDGNDFTTRVIAPGLTVGLGQQVIIDNRSGKFNGENLVAKALPDGYTLLLKSSSFWLEAVTQTDVPLPYDPIRDFSPITVAITSPSVLVVNPSLRVKSVKELIALTKARPGELNCAVTIFPGGSVNLAAYLFQVMTGSSVVLVSYKGTAQGLTGLLGGEAQLMFANAAAVTSHIKSGRLIALGVSTAKPTNLFPGVPTLSASGLPSFEVGATFAIFAPANTPVPIINRLNQEIVRVLNLPDIKDKFFNAGSEVVGNSPEQLAEIVRSDITKWGKVIKDLGIRNE